MALLRKPAPPDPRTQRRLRIERAVLALVTVASLGWSLWWAWDLAHTPGFSLLVQRGESGLVAAYERGAARAATPQALADRLQARLDQDPRDWVVIDALSDLADAQGIALPDPLIARRDALKAADTGWIATGLDCAACAWDLRDCTLSAALACGVAINVTPLGDVVALAREGGHYVAGAPVDQVDVGISFVGLAATGLVVVTGGTSLTVKAGAALLRVAHRMRRLAPGLLAVFRRAFVWGIDWARLPAVRGADDLARLARPRLIRPAVALAEDLGHLNARLGTRQTLHLMGAIDTPAEAARFARASDALGPRTLGTLEMMGKSRFLRLGMRLANEVWALVAGVLGLFSAGLGLLTPLLHRAARPGLRLIVRIVLR
ncbi:MAG: hypothetical protein H6900_05935 [Rhodobacter sp.]|uniref:hypothetical protein n=1 Tax=Pararhodobacter sp. TaxID=2127056 RepID=UPI001DB6E809|nr:hypothetical protein [Pararhodobacter sp.]MCB1345137.1 hypothetical protein [Paracoccaceae bacterium]MCC0072813.1 hypothetical protein [Rhodobacter sp.]HPD90920.1 hypothetical protein [Pararhodobacter sp.]